MPTPTTINNNRILFSLVILNFPKKQGGISGFTDRRLGLGGPYFTAIIIKYEINF